MHFNHVGGNGKELGMIIKSNWTRLIQVIIRYSTLGSQPSQMRPKRIGIEINSTIVERYVDILVYEL